MTRTQVLLTPPGQSADEKSPLAALSTKDRMRLVRQAVDNNRERLERLDGLLDDELRQAEAQATQQDPNAAAQPGAPAEQAELRQKYERAEQLRAQAALHLEGLADGLAAIESGRSRNLLDPATKTLADLEQLRRLFFDLVEHLKELLSNQTETHDSANRFAT